MKRYLFLLVFASLLLSCKAQQKESQPQVNDKSFIVISYNCENLFDTINDPLTDDDDFTPTGKNQWDTKRYNRKLENLAKVLTSLHETNYPAVVGLIEVENRNVVEDLFSKTKLNKYRYSVVHHDSKDGRGIDVAVAYREDLFKVLSEQAIPVVYPDEIASGKKKAGRNIQYVEGLVMGCDTLHIFVNHWKSRLGGQDETEKMRMYEAQILRDRVDSVYFARKNAKILIMGDFNDEPENKSLTEVLKATGDEKTYAKVMLYNMMYKLKKEGKGTHEYKKEWNMLDQIIVNKGFFAQKPGKIYTSMNAAGIIKKDWMLYKDKEGNMYPSSTFGNNKYYGGFSDHLPVYIVIEKKD